MDVPTPSSLPAGSLLPSLGCSQNCDVGAVGEVANKGRRHRQASSHQSRSRVLIDATRKVANRFKNFPFRLTQVFLRCVALGHIQLVVDKLSLVLADAEL
jgi:hypothetical protein